MNQQSTIAERPNKTSRRSGFTLLEVLLAIAISIFVAGLIGGVMYFQLRTLKHTRAEVDQAQLARALNGYIASDLRNLIKYDPLDVASLVPGGGGAAAMGAEGAGGEARKASELEIADSLDALAKAAEGESTEDDASTSDEVGLLPEETPGLRGAADWLKIDNSRLPRRDQLLAAASGGLGTALCDVKTVTYQVVAPSMDFPEGGLVRAEVPRAEALVATLEAGSEEEIMITHARLLAPEVAAVRFQYSDGEIWHEVWPPVEAQTSEEAAVLPVAIHMIVYFKPEDFDPTAFVGSIDPAALAAFPKRRLIVGIPTAVKAAAEEPVE